MWQGSGVRGAVPEEKQEEAIGEGPASVALETPAYWRSCETSTAAAV